MTEFGRVSRAIGTAGHREHHQSHNRAPLATGWKFFHAWQGCADLVGVVRADTELEAEVEPSLETEQRLAAEEAAQKEAARKHEAALTRLAHEALAQAAEAEKQRAQQEADLERLRQVGALCKTPVLTKE